MHPSFSASSPNDIVSTVRRLPTIFAIFVFPVPGVPPITIAGIRFRQIDFKISFGSVTKKIDFVN